MPVSSPRANCAPIMTDSLTKRFSVMIRGWAALRIWVAWAEASWVRVCWGVVSLGSAGVPPAIATAASSENNQNDLSGVACCKIDLMPSDLPADQSPGSGRAPLSQNAIETLRLSDSGRVCSFEEPGGIRWAAGERLPTGGIENGVPLDAQGLTWLTPDDHVETLRHPIL